MLFNSFEFIFGFLPATLVCFYAIGVVSREWALRWIIFISFVFYAWWRPLNVLLIAPSILINFATARLLQRLSEDDERSGAARAVLLLGLAFNVAFLGYFKYSDFARGTVNDIFGTNLVLTHVILPLGISFITFQKIAFLIDVHAKRVKSFSLQDYCLFVLFFPQLIAGPIVHYREMMPQFHSASCRFNKKDLAVGLTLFSFGLFKKVVLADHIASFVTPIYGQAASAGGISVLMAWAAAVGFTLQIYFDFSGYSDMALGLGRFFGIRLPQNFNSPLQASSIIDFWQRWHMTLTRFLTAYIYNPLTLSSTRRRMSKGHPALAGQNTTVGAFIDLLMFPLLLTMLISGLWHGAGYGFIVWGFLHGAYLTINHAWRLIRPRLWSDRTSYERFMRPTGWLLTFTCVAVSMVFFRSSTMASAIDILQGLIGLNGVALPAPDTAAGQGLLRMLIWIVALTFIAVVCPNTLQILARYEPALGVKPQAAGDGRRLLEWNPSPAWAIAVSIIAAVAVSYMQGYSEFLYWQF